MLHVKVVSECVWSLNQVSISFHFVSRRLALMLTSCWELLCLLGCLLGSHVFICDSIRLGVDSKIVRTASEGSLLLKHAAMF